MRQKFYRLITFMLIIIFCLTLSSCKKSNNLRLASSSCQSNASSEIIDYSQIASDGPSEQELPIAESSKSSATTNKSETNSITNSEQTTSFQFDSNVVIQTVKQDISNLNTKTAYGKNDSSFFKEQISILSNQSQEDISNKLYNNILDVLNYDSYLAFTDSPNEAPLERFDYTYYLEYAGVAKDMSEHIFILYYKENAIQPYTTEIFNSNIVVEKVIDYITNSKIISLNCEQYATDFKEEDLIDIVNSLSTEQVADYLNSKIENNVRGKNFNVNNNFTTFRIDYYGMTDSKYWFKLYLK